MGSRAAAVGVLHAELQHSQRTAVAQIVIPAWLLLLLPAMPSITTPLALHMGPCLPCSCCSCSRGKRCRSRRRWTSAARQIWREGGRCFPTALARRRAARTEAPAWPAAHAPTAADPSLLCCPLRCLLAAHTAFPAQACPAHFSVLPPSHASLCCCFLVHPRPRVVSDSAMPSASGYCRQVTPSLRVHKEGSGFIKSAAAQGSIAQQHEIAEGSGHRAVLRQYAGAQKAPWLVGRKGTRGGRNQAAQVVSTWGFGRSISLG